MTAAALMACWELGSACDPPPPAPPAPHAPADEAPPPSPAAADESVEDEEALPAHQYRGVAGFRMPLDGACPPGYSLTQGVCAHARLLAAESPAALQEELRAFIGGAVPPIVADAPPGGPRDPAAMDPGALRPTDAQLRQQAEARALLALHEGAGEPATEGSRAPAGGTQVAAAAGASPAATPPAGPGANPPGAAPAAPVPLDASHLLSLLGPAALPPGQGSGASPGAGPPDKLDATPEAMKMIEALQQMTGDGEVDLQEAGHMFEMLRTQLDGTQLPPELLPGSRNDSDRPR